MVMKGIGSRAILASAIAALAIIDLSSNGHQPMISGNNRYIFSYNGEIYNFRELRAELETAGYQFRSETGHRGCA